MKEAKKIETNECSCKRTYTLLRTVCVCGSILGAGLIIAGSILLTTEITKPMHQPISIHVPIDHELAIRRFVKKNPQFIIDTLSEHAKAESQKAQQQQVAPKEIIEEVVADKTNYSLGNPEGKFVIIEFFDHKCGWCKRTNKAMHEALANADAKNIRWIPIDTPIFGEQSEEIARFVLAAGKQGKYAEMHVAVGKEAKVDRAKLIEIGKNLKLNTKKLEADADGDELKAKLENNKKYAQALGISGVPFLIINGKVHPGALLDKNLEEVVKESQKAE